MEEFKEALGADIVDPNECYVCGGRIYRKKNPATGRPLPGNIWLHLRVEDWRHNPHNAIPKT